MARLLFKLNGVPEDEAEDIRQLLDENHIDCYETPAGRWGISLAAIWLKDDAQLVQAREIIDRYQHERFHHARQEYERLKREGKLETLVDRIRVNPLLMLFYLIAILVVLFFSIWPFLQLSKG